MTLVVKLGSSIVAADDGELRAGVLDSVCDQVAALESGGERVVLVTSGAIARGMRLMGMEKRPRAMDELQAASAVGQGDLFQAYERRLRERGARAAQVLLTRADIQRRSHYLNARQTLERLINWRVVPVINENDTTASEEINFGDNDFLAAQVAVFLRARLLVLLTNTEGLYTADPKSNPSASLIEDLDDFEQLGGVRMAQTSTFGRGGMVSKVAAAERASRAGVEAVICNGTRPDTLLDAVAGRRVGTRIAPMRRAGKSLPVLKLWMKHGQQPHGAIRVDSGAAEMLREKGSSLLAVGIKGVQGRFDAGDVVDVIDDASERPVGRGITDLSRDDLSLVLGKRSAEVMEVIPNAPKQVIHRDRFVLV